MTEKVTEIHTDSKKSRFNKKKATILGVSAVFVAGVILVVDDKLKKARKDTSEETETSED